MSQALREYRRTHDGKSFPLVALREALRENPSLGSADLAKLSRELALPAASLRAAITYYADFQTPKNAVRVCAGTSCMFAGAGELHAAVAARGPCERVYCLGYCDRSPALLRPDSSAAVKCDPAKLDEILSAPAPIIPAPSIRCIARERIVTRNIINGDLSDLRLARDSGIYGGLDIALRRSPADIIESITCSGERGRGGAAFLTGIKWKRAAETSADRRYVVANGDEGDPGSFIDRVLMEDDPHSVIEGMAICGHAIGAKEGIVFIRSEYPRAISHMTKAISQVREAGLLGNKILGSDFDFDITVFPGMGSYVCGEETALLNAIEGFRGEVSPRPPYPAECGLFGKPTVVNNVETLVNIPWIVRRGDEAYRTLGTAATSGTKAICLNHAFAQPGIVEVEFGISLRDVIEKTGGGGSGGTKIDAIILGGPMGSVLFPEEWDVPVCYSTMAQRGIQLGHGGIVGVPDGTNYSALLHHWLRFMQSESCGKCVPCREGSRVALSIAPKSTTAAGSATLRQLFNIMEKGSLCAFGQLLPAPMRRLLERAEEKR